jgi:hypothetical protein
MTEMPEDFTPDEAVSAQRINGVIDVPRPGRVAGWAIDRADPDAAVMVTVLREGRVIGEVRADAHRADLERGGIGTGRYGFALELDPPLEPGFEFTVTAVARAGDGTTGEIRPVGRARPSGDEDRRLAERTFDELTQVRSALRHAAGRQDRAAEMRALEILDRVEVVQARIELALAATEATDRRPRGRGLALAVAAALAAGCG